jgi:hypothetical protein
MCVRLDEDGGHLFLKCKKVRHVWRELLLEDVCLKLIQAPNPMQMFESLWGLSKEKTKADCHTTLGLVDSEE